MARRYHHRLALLALLGFAFAQFSLLAYACPKQAGGESTVLASAQITCAESAVAPPAGNLCEVHCLDGVASAPTTADGSPAAAFTVFVLPVAFPPVITLPVESRRAALATMATAPPFPVRFCRFLI